MSEIKLGEIIIEGIANRDAVHVAVAPVIAGEDLEPGEHVSFDENGAVVGYRSSGMVGIIDPFLKFTVAKGEKCWLFLYPKTALNLRHEWEHPAFRHPPSLEKEASVQWITDYAAANNVKYEDLMEGVREYLGDGEKRTEYKSATMEDHFKNLDTPDEFWIHYKNITGVLGNGSFWGCCI